jgi:NAD(P)-dependent dehydrogenase (short-subunit alcohol dehydrogenase family)
MISQGKERGRGGRIVGASSIAGKQGAGQVAAYCTSKFAVRGLTQSAGMCYSSSELILLQLSVVLIINLLTLLIAKEWGPYNITVNAYAPGPLAGTEMCTFPPPFVPSSSFHESFYMILTSYANAVMFE